MPRNYDASTMAKFFQLARYAFAVLCCATSIGCVALWGWTSMHATFVVSQLHLFGCPILCEADGGKAFVALYSEFHDWHFETGEAVETEWTANLFGNRRWFGYGRFMASHPSVYFPLWYPAIVFALAAVGVVRLGQRFTMRSALFGVGLVANLLGVAAAM